MSLNWINWGLVWIAHHNHPHCAPESNLLTSPHWPLLIGPPAPSWAPIGWDWAVPLIVTRGKLEWMSPDESLETSWHQAQPGGHWQQLEIELWTKRSKDHPFLFNPLRIYIRVAFVFSVRGPGVIITDLLWRNNDKYQQMRIERGGGRREWGPLLDETSTDWWLVKHERKYWIKN